MNTSKKQVVIAVETLKNRSQSEEGPATTKAKNFLMKVGSGLAVVAND